MNRNMTVTMDPRYQEQMKTDVSFKGGDRTVGDAFDRYPLAVLTHMADLWASHIDETKPEKKIGGANA